MQGLLKNILFTTLSFTALAGVALVAPLAAQDAPVMTLAAAIAAPAEEIVELPAPVSVPVDTLAAEAFVPPPSDLELVADRLQRIGRPHLLVVRARVESRQGVERVLPAELYWGTEPVIATELGLAVLDTFCGAAPGKRLTVTHIGGTLPDGRREYTSLLPRDLELGQEDVFFLREIGGEYFLELGRRDLLSSDERGGFRDAAAEAITFRNLKGVCP